MPSLRPVRPLPPAIVCLATFSLLFGAVGCGGGGGSGAGSGGASGSGGESPAAGSGGTSGSGGASGSGGLTGSGGTTSDAATGADAPGGTDAASAAVPAGGDHFCQIDVGEAGGWYFGAQKKCIVTFAKSPPLTTDQKKALDYNCTSTPGTVVADCPRADAVAYCAGVSSPVIPYTQYILVDQSSINPDATSVAINAGVCGGTSYTLDGKKMSASCAGTLTAKVDGVAVDFSTHLICWFKSNGTKSEYFISGQSTAGDKSLNLTVHQEAGQYSVPGTALMPGVGYTEGTISTLTFPFPKDVATQTVDVATFMPSGAGLKSGFSIGEIYRQPGAKGDVRTITEGAVDIQITTTH